MIEYLFFSGYLYRLLYTIYTVYMYMTIDMYCLLWRLGALLYATTGSYVDMHIHSA